MALCGDFDEVLAAADCWEVDDEVPVFEKTETRFVGSVTPTRAFCASARRQMATERLLLAADFRLERLDSSTKRSAAFPLANGGAGNMNRNCYCWGRTRPEECAE